MNKKLVGAIAGGLLTVTTIAGVNEVSNEIKSLHKSIAQIEQEKIEKDEEIKELKGILLDKEQEIKIKDVDIDNLKEERKMLYNEIESLKKNNNTTYSNKKISFNQSNLKNTSGVDAKRLNKALEGTNLHGLGDAYVQAEKTYGVNAIFLTALTAQESGWGNSNRARTQNNLSGYAVYSDSSAGKTFSSKTSSIMATAKLLSNDYLNSNGKYYKGTDIFSVNSSYCPNDNFDWANKITSIAYDLIKEINSL